jgi:exopolysaccharide biosynthesis polyprenyl glycosylphosphotransferase
LESAVSSELDDPRPGVLSQPRPNDDVVTTPTRHGQPLRRERWESRYTVVTVAVDLAAIAVSVVVGYLLGLGASVPQFGDVAPGVGLLSAFLMIIALLVCRAWDPRVLGQGSEEYSRLLRAVVTSAVALGLLSLAFDATTARPWVFGLMPGAGVLAVLGRLLLRRWLHRMRAAGRCALPVLVVGSVDSVAALVERTRRDVARGWVVTGACTSTGTGVGGSDFVNGVPVLGDLDAVASVARRGEHRVVAVCPAPGQTSRRLHQLAWEIEEVAAELVVDPGLMEVAGPRLHIEPVDGLPLLRLTSPAYSGAAWVAKHVLDRIGALALLLVLAPVLAAVAIAIKFDGGPVFFRQVRVGRHGREFRMLKFRSMDVDAEDRLVEVLAANEGAGPLFKLKADPRVTPVGRILRRYSLDELPQLFNALAGTMSLVGPRPPLPSEVETYGTDAQRKLLVRPGLTGLWQISGRSDLSWEESVRLDLRYVENWNLALDARILLQTVGAVVRSRGAY